MALTPCSDLSPAGWITSSMLPWQQLVTFGPAGFPDHARLRFIPDPAYPGQSENDIDVEPGAIVNTCGSIFVRPRFRPAA